MRKIEKNKSINLDIIAENFVCAHALHSQALEESSLTYIDKLMDAFLANSQGTVREIASDLLDVVPGLAERDALCLARTKFLGIGLDEEVA